MAPRNSGKRESMSWQHSMKISGNDQNEGMYRGGEGTTPVTRGLSRRSPRVKNLNLWWKVKVMMQKKNNTSVLKLMKQNKIYPDTNSSTGSRDKHGLSMAVSRYLADQTARRDWRIALVTWRE